MDSNQLKCPVCGGQFGSKEELDTHAQQMHSEQTSEQEQFQYYLLFRDETTGTETYKNGRMLQIPKREYFTYGY